MAAGVCGLMAVDSVEDLFRDGGGLVPLAVAAEDLFRRGGGPPPAVEPHRFSIG